MAIGTRLSRFFGGLIGLCMDTIRRMGSITTAYILALISRNLLPGFSILLDFQGLVFTFAQVGSLQVPKEELHASVHSPRRTFPCPGSVRWMVPGMYARRCKALQRAPNVTCSSSRVN